MRRQSSRYNAAGIALVSGRVSQLSQAPAALLQALHKEAQDIADSLQCTRGSRPQSLRGSSSVSVFASAASTLQAARGVLCAAKNSRKLLSSYVYCLLYKVTM